MANYTFITPDQCHDMHGRTGCPNSNTIKAGDDWLKAELPRIITWVNAHAGVISITWDEGDSSNKLAFLAIGPGAKADYAGGVRAMKAPASRTTPPPSVTPLLDRVSAESAV